MIKNYIKKDPDKVEAVQFNGLNYLEIDKFLRSKAIYSELISKGKRHKIVFYNNFEKTEIDVGKYIVFDSAIKVLSIMSEVDFMAKYEETGLGIDYAK